MDYDLCAEYILCIYVGSAASLTTFDYQRLPNSYWVSSNEASYTFQ